jgi:excisionase family DNA binding protein
MYSTEEVAGLLGLHVRTVRGYVRDGRLPATRIGKQYRIARDDLDAFTGTRQGQSAGGASQPLRAEASAVVQVAPLGPDAMSRLSTLVTAAASARQDDDPLHVQTVYDPHRAALKIIVTGTAGDTAAVLALISTITREQE